MCICCEFIYSNGLKCVLAVNLSIQMDNKNTFFLILAVERTPLLRNAPA